MQGIQQEEVKRYRCAFVRRRVLLALVWGLTVVAAPLSLSEAAGAT